jgi:hypothetical protein
VYITDVVSKKLVAVTVPVLLEIVATEVLTTRQVPPPRAPEGNAQVEVAPEQIVTLKPNNK